jgi:hypothetical protein
MILYIETERSFPTLLAQCKKLGYKDEKDAGIIYKQAKSLEGWTALRNRVLTMKTVGKRSDYYGDDTYTGWRLSDESKKLGVDTIIIDTISSLNQVIRQEIRRSAGRKLNWDEWDKISNELIESLLAFCDCDATVIMLCHTQTVKEESPEETTLHLTPQLTGRSAEEFPKQFDFVFLSECLARKGRPSYIWRTEPIKQITLKDRTASLGSEIPQNFKEVLDTAKENGFQNNKFLILGKSGTGKTFSLSTLLSTKTNTGAPR